MHKIFSNTVIYRKPQAFYVKERNSSPIPHHFPSTHIAILKKTRGGRQIVSPSTIKREQQQKKIQRLKCFCIQNIQINR